jgi:hypothetical protein
MSRSDYKETRGRGKLEIGFSFPPNGASAVAASSIVQDASKPVLSVVRTAAGKYTITLNEYPGTLVGAKAHLRMNVPDGSQAALGPLVAGSKTIECWLIDASNPPAAADVAANANNVVTVTLEFDRATTA